MTGFLPPLDDAAADHLKPGLALPRIALPATEGPDICLAMLPGRSIVAVYPWTGSPGHANPPNWDHIPGAHGSTPELEGFRDRAEAFARHDTRIFGVSGQTTGYQRALAARLALPFPILSDADGQMAAALALPSFAAGSESYLKRLTLVVADGCIETVFYPVRDPAGHAAEIVTWLDGQG
jgi:peroxiredoxin